MTDTPDLEQLARRYLDLWQDQMAAMVTDPGLAEAMAKSYGMMVKGVEAIAQATGVTPTMATQTTAAAGAHEQTGQSSSSSTSSSSPAGAASPAVPSDDPGGELAGLKARLAGLEERIARLEAGVPDGGGKPAAKPVRRRSRAV